MLAGRRILAVVPARGGSKGVTLKNLHPLGGIPLIAHAGRVIAALPMIDRAVVSTDHPAIAAAATAAGIDAPFTRPPELSGDRVPDLPVLRHALEETERLDNVRYDVVVMLQPTSPLRTPDHVRATLTKLIEGSWDAVWTVSSSEMRFHPLKQLVLDAAGVLRHFDSRGAAVVARQELTPVYHRNGVAYALSRTAIIERKELLPARTSALVLDEPLVNIDTEEDFARAEMLLRARASIFADRPLGA